MQTRAAAPRVLVLAAVAAGHAGALLALLALSRTHVVPAAHEEPWILVMLPPTEVRPARPPALEHPLGPTPSMVPAQSGASRPSQPSEVAVTSTSIDWKAEAAREADRVVERNEQRARQARALSPAPSAAFAPAGPGAPEFGWDYAATHRVQAVGGGATVIHLGDRCALALWLVIPMGFGCALGRVPARGDLFEHLHDQGEPGEGR